MARDIKKTWDACGEAFDQYTTAQDSFSDNIERPAIERLIGDVRGVCVLDFGCGSATYGAWLAARGANVTGLDLSTTMLSLAVKRSRDHRVDIDLCLADINEPLPFADGAFDLVFTATALHYVKDLEAVMREAARVMKAEARLIASVLHPMSTARFPEAGSETIAASPWELRHEWQLRYFGNPVRAIETPWLGFGNTGIEGQKIFCRHHTIGDYFGALQNAGLTIRNLLEPAPSVDFSRKNPARYEEALSVPVYLIIEAQN